MKSDEIIGSRTADELVGGRISSYVRSGRIAPVQKLPGRRGALLFRRGDVERLADELRQELADEMARLDAARNVS